MTSGFGLFEKAMKIPRIKLLIILILVFSSCLFGQEKGVKSQSVSQLPAKEKRFALIVGVNNYGLKGAVNDAQALKDVLVKYAGFPEKQVILLTTEDSKNLPTKRNITLELNKLSRRIEPDGLFLFAFSGHGKTINNEGYLIPSDGEWSDNPTLLEELSINVNKIKKAIEEMKVKQVLMLIDACRDRIEAGQKGNESEPLTDAINRGFSFYEANKSVEAFVTIYATRIGEFAYEYFDSETNQMRGYFSKAIEETLSGKASIANDKGEITLAALVKYVQETVPKRSYQNNGKRQTPFKSSNDGFNENELVLAVTNNKLNSVSQTTNLNPLTSEQAFWKAIQNSNEIDDFEEYILKCERGEFSGIYKATAELRLNRIKKEKGKLLWKEFSRKAKLYLKYDGISAFSEGLAKVRKNNKYGFIDQAGNEIVIPKYDSAISFKEGLALVGINITENSSQSSFNSDEDGDDAVPMKYGFIDRKGNLTIPMIYKNAYPFSEGIASVNLNGKIGFINKMGKIIIKPTFDVEDQDSDFILSECDEDEDEDEDLSCDYFYQFKNGVTMAAKNGNYGLIDKNGKQITPFIYKGFSNYKDGIFRFNNSGKQFYFDVAGIEYKFEQYDCSCEYSEGLFEVKKNSKYGFVDKNNKILIPLIYDDVKEMLDGFAVARLNKNYGVINKVGEQIFAFKYNEIENLGNGFLIAKSNERFYFLDTNKSEELQLKRNYNTSKPFFEGLAQVTFGEKIGFLNSNGVETIPAKYDKVWSHFAFRKEGFIGVILNGRKGFVDIYGNEYFDF